MALSEAALDQIRQIVADEVSKAFQPAELVTAEVGTTVGPGTADIVTRIEQLGTLLVHGQLPTDPEGTPSRAGLDQIQAALDQLAGEVGDLSALLDQIRTVVFGGHLRLAVAADDPINAPAQQAADSGEQLVGPEPPRVEATTLPDQHEDAEVDQ